MGCGRWAVGTCLLHRDLPVLLVSWYCRPLCRVQPRLISRLGARLLSQRKEGPWWSRRCHPAIQAIICRKGAEERRKWRSVMHVPITRDEMQPAGSDRAERKNNDNWVARARVPEWETVGPLPPSEDYCAMRITRQPGLARRKQHSQHGATIPMVSKLPRLLPLF